MITREEIRQLAQVESPAGCAISFYFQPQTPQNGSHREEAILIKDMVRDVLRKAERNGNHAALREDLAKILQIAEGLHGNHSRGKVIFACREQGIWREKDIPPRAGPVADQGGLALPPAPAGATLIPGCRAPASPWWTARGRASLNCRRAESRKDWIWSSGPRPHVPRSDGFQGYEAGHRERHVENQVMQHYKMFAESLLSMLSTGKNSMRC